MYCAGWVGYHAVTDSPDYHIALRTTRSFCTHRAPCSRTALHIPVLLRFAIQMLFLYRLPYRVCYRSCSAFTCYCLRRFVTVYLLPHTARLFCTFYAPRYTPPFYARCVPPPAANGYAARLTLLLPQPDRTITYAVLLLSTYAVSTLPSYLHWFCTTMPYNIYCVRSGTSCTTTRFLYPPAIYA